MLDDGGLITCQVYACWRRREGGHLIESLLRSYCDHIFFRSEEKGRGEGCTRVFLVCSYCDSNVFLLDEEEGRRERLRIALLWHSHCTPIWVPVGGGRREGARMFLLSAIYSYGVSVVFLLGEEEGRGRNSQCIDSIHIVFILIPD